MDFFERMAGVCNARAGSEGSTDSDSEYPERDIENDFLPDLDEEMLLKMKRNDPSVTKVDISFEEELFADGINWETEGYWIVINTKLKELDLYEFQSERDDGEDEDGIRNFEAFCRGVSHNKSIQCLYIEGVSNDALMTDHLPRFIRDSYSKNLRRLHLHNCFYSQDHIRKLIGALSFPKTMEKSNMKAEAEGREYKFDKSSRLQQFIFSSKQINDHLAGELVEALRYHKDLLKIELTLMRDKMGSTGCTALGSLLEDPTMKLKTLVLSALNLDDECLTLVGKGLAKNTTIKKITLESNASRYVFLDDSVKSTAAGWRSFFGHLIKSKCNLEEVNASANALATFQSLRTLNIGGNPFTAAAWDALSIYLRSSRCNLETLDIYNGGLGAVTLLILTYGLRHNSTLMKLKIDRNQVDSQEAWHSFFSLLESPKSTLVDISCQNCGIGSEGIQNIHWEMVQLKKLDLGWNRIGDEGLGAIRELCNTLQTLDLRNNRSISTEAWVEFSNVLRDHRCSLEELTVEISSGDDKEVFSAFASNIAPNISLDTLDFNNTHWENFPARDWALFANTLCNSTSIKDTYESNHTVSQIFNNYEMERLREAGGPARKVWRCLDWNKNSNKFQVVRQKIIYSHFCGSISESEGNAKEFVDMDLEVLPHVLAWAGRDSFGHSALYQILRIFPSLTSFVGGSSGGKLLGLKRKCAPE